MSTNVIGPLNSPPSISPILQEESFINGQIKKTSPKNYLTEGLSASSVFAFTSRARCDHYHFPSLKNLIKTANIVSFIGISFFSWGATYAWYLCLKNNNFKYEDFIKPKWLGSFIYSKSTLICAITLQIFFVSSIAIHCFKNIKEKNKRIE